MLQASRKISDALEPFRLRNHNQQPALISSAINATTDPHELSSTTNHIPIGREPKGNVEGLPFVSGKFSKSATLLYHNCRNAGYCKKVGRTRVVSRPRSTRRQTQPLPEALTAQRGLAPAELVYVPWLHEMQEMDAATTGVLVMRDGMLGTQVR